MVWELIFHYRGLSPILLLIEVFHVNKVTNTLDNMTTKVVTNGFIITSQISTYSKLYGADERRAIETDGR